MKTTTRWAALIIVWTGAASAATFDLPEGVTVQRIWDKAPHSAFTDLVRWENQFYCTFRESTDHVHGEDGKIRVIRSKDGMHWESVALFESEGIDLRDPKLSITPDDRLMVLCGGSRYEGRELVGRAPKVAFLAAPGEKFSEPEGIVIDPSIVNGNDWLWRVTWHGDTGYGIVYQSDRGGKPWGLHLVSTKDGVRYDSVTALDIEGKPNESTVCVLPTGEMFAVVRNEDGKQRGHLGRAKPPYKDWNWVDIPSRLGGPDFTILSEEQMILGTRHYGSPTHTVLGTLAHDGAFDLRVTLPSGGDTSYPGLLIHEGKLWASYYASHEEKTAIYLATVPLEVFR